MIDIAGIFSKVTAGGFTDAQALSFLTRLNWIAQRWPEKGARQTEKSLKANPQRVLPMIIQVAIESGDPIGRIAATWLEKNGTPALANTALALLPTQSVSLRELAAIAQTIELKNTNDPASRAGSLNNLANRLSALGQREAALAAAKEAVAIYRTLASARPDAFMPDLAMSLNNLANRLSALGQREAALAAAKEAVAIYRTLASARPDAFMPDLAMSLNNLAGFLSALGQREAALAAAQEAVAMRRTLASARPDAFMPDLAASLNNLAGFLSALGQREAALAAAQEAVAALQEPFLALPAAHASHMLVMCRVYLASCEALDKQPSTDLLEPIITALTPFLVPPPERPTENSL